MARLRSLGRLRGTLGACLAIAAVACSNPSPTAESTIDRETFIATYVDLRLSALGTQTGEITEAERTRVLTEHGVSEDDLLSFADAWGSEPEVMRAVWEEVQTRLRRAAGEDTGDVEEEGS
jgi:hypothetical protein